MKVVPRLGILTTLMRQYQVEALLAVRVSERTLRLQYLMYSGRHRSQLKRLSGCRPLRLWIQPVAVVRLVSAYNCC